MSQNQVAGFPVNDPPDTPPIAPPLFQRGNELDLIVPTASFDEVVRIPMDTFVPGQPAPIPLPAVAEQPPAVLGLGQTLAAVAGPGPRFLHIDATLGQRYVDKLLHTGQDPTLTATCNGLLVTGTSNGGIAAQAFDALGNALGPMLAAEAEPVTSALWDGASVVVAAKNSIAELYSNGSVRSVTPAPSTTLAGKWAAVGTDDGLLVTTDSNGPTTLRLLERGTGAVLAEYGKHPGEVAVAGDHLVYFFHGETYEGSYIAYTVVECSDTPP